MSSEDKTIFNLPTLVGPLEDTARIPVSIGSEIDDTFYFTPLDLNTFLDGFFLSLTAKTLAPSNPLYLYCSNLRDASGLVKIKTC